MAKLRDEEFIDLLLKINFIDVDSDKSLKNLIFDNRDSENFKLIRDYFFDKKTIEELNQKLFNEDFIKVDKLEEVLKQLVMMYPFSKRLLDKIIYINSDDRDIEIKTLKILISKSNLFIKGVEEYIKSLKVTFGEKEEINHLKKREKEIKNLNLELEKLKENLENKKKNDAEYQKKLKEREKLTDEIKTLENSIIDYSKINKEELEKLDNLEKECEELKNKIVENQEKIKERNKEKKKLEEHLKKEVERENDGTEDELIKQLIELWSDVD